MMKRALVLVVALLALLIGTVGYAQSYTGSNLGAIPDGIASAPESYGAPRDVYFDVGPVRTVTALTVSFTGTHTWVGDLRVTLIAPNGVSHLLFARTGVTTAGGYGLGSDLNGTYTFTDNAAAQNWWTGAATNPVPAGSYRTVVSGGAGVSNPAAVTALNPDFVATPANGRWILRFEDGASSDTGNIIAATLNLMLTGSTINVTNANDSGSGSLRGAMLAASSGDVIRFATPFFSTQRTINLLTPLPDITVPMAIQGPGADLLTVRRDDSAGDMRIFFIGSSVSRVSLGGMTISNGRVGGLSGGGIASLSPLTLSGMNVSGNRAAYGAGVAFFSSGDVINSTFSGNEGEAEGSGIYHRVDFGDPELRIVNSTVSGNRSTSFGAGISAVVTSGTSMLAVVDSTIADNQSPVVGAGSGIRAVSYATGSAQVSLRNSIVARNGPKNFSAEVGGSGSATITSLGFNLSDNYDGVVASLATDLIGDPRLGPLAPQGGAVPTRLLLGGSPALEAGNSSGLASDQRGQSRPYDNPGISNTNGGNGADIGAVEMQSILVTNTNDAGAGSLRDAVAYANNNGPELFDIIFDGSTFASPQTINVLGPQMLISNTLTISGPGADRLSISRSPSSPPDRLFIISQFLPVVAFSGLKVQGGIEDNLGGGILSSSQLTLANVHVQGNVASTGAGVNLRDAGGTFIDSTFSDNHSVYLDNSRGGAGSNDGGAIALRDSGTSLLRLINCTISGNSSEVAAGGISNVATSLGPTSTMEIINSTIALNSGTVSGGMLAQAKEGGTAATILVRNSIAANNGGINFQVDANSGSATITSRGFNLTDTANAAFLNQPTDQNSANAGLAPLANNGGRTPTHTLLAGSDALDGGDNTGSGMLSDQRGSNYLRAVNLPLTNIGDGSDIGAYEAQFDPADLIFANGFD
jgi:subtilisin-like proprotein convertase family protein